MNLAYEAPPGVRLDSVVTTEDLLLRASKKPDYRAECEALLVLSEHLSISPHTILQKLVEVTLDIFRAGSAGVSLLAKENGGKTFYWPAIAGAWHPHVGGGTPRDFGPCGVVLDRNAGQLFTRPEAYFPYLLQASPLIHEALLAPIYDRGKAVGTVWVILHVQDSDRSFDKEDLRLLSDLAKFAAGAYKVLQKLEKKPLPRQHGANAFLR